MTLEDHQDVCGYCGASRAPHKGWCVTGRQELFAPAIEQILQALHAFENRWYE